MNSVINQASGVSSDHIQQVNEHLAGLLHQWHSVIVGQTDVCEKLLVAVISNGHVLLEGVPGLAKTLTIRTLADLIGGNYKRIQFTPDMLPSDIIGTQIYNAQKQAFEVKKGPVFAQFILADEINRAPAKVQSALLEAMQEQQVTIGNDTFALEQPFFVLATQNPIDQDGTYALPEAQMDRFIFKLTVNYPNSDEEKQLIHRFQTGFPRIDKPVMSPQQIQGVQSIAKQIYIDDRVSEYVIRLVHATRDPQSYGLNDIVSYIRCGASPRATLAFISATKAYACVQKRNYVIPEDVKHLAHDILRHRLHLTFTAEAEGVSTDTIIDTILGNIEVP